MDEENREINENEEPETEEATPTEKVPREPTSNDYMAGALLANGIIWLWMQSLTMFSGFMSLAR